MIGLAWKEGKASVSHRVDGNWIGKNPDREPEKEMRIFLINLKRGEEDLKPVNRKHTYSQKNNDSIHRWSIP